MFIKGMYGLGDNIYQRAFVREIRETVFLKTSWPQLYRDLSHVRPVLGQTKLRTQQKNILAQNARIWYPSPVGVSRRIHYNFHGHVLSGGTILGSMKERFRVGAKIFDLPSFPRFPIEGEYAVIRPATIRQEWLNSARNPRDEYLIEAAQCLQARGLKVVSVADLEPGVEWAEKLPPYDIAFHRGELALESLLGLIQGASVVVGGVGWIVPAAIASGVPLIVVLGGQGGHNDPSRLVGEPMNLERVRWIRPDNYCPCKNMQHCCSKTITGFGFKFEMALEELCLTQSAIAN